MSKHTRVVSIAIVVAMILSGVWAVSFNASSLDVGKNSVTYMASLPAGVTINDVAWMGNGDLALAVGKNDTGGANSFWYNPHTDSWIPMIPTTAYIFWEFVYGPQGAFEVGPFQLANHPIWNATFYTENGGAPTKLAEGVDYTLDYQAGEITMLSPMLPGWNLHSCYNYTGQELNGVVWSDFHGKFGVVGDALGAGDVTMLSCNPYAPAMFPVTDNGSAPTGDLRDLALDEYANLLCVGPNDAVYFFDGDSDWWYSVTDADDSGWHYNGVSYDEKYHRFYIVGGNGVGGGIAYTDIIPDNTTAPAFHYNYASVPEMNAWNTFNAIAWNNDPTLPANESFGFVLGEEVLGAISPIDVAPLLALTNMTIINFTDVAFEKTDWTDATLIGHNSTLNTGYIWQWNSEVENIVLLNQTNSQMLYCVDYRRPSSPSFGFVVGSGGGAIINTNAFDIGTELTVNTDKPHIFDVDMWETSDLTRASVLNSRVDVEETYSFGVTLNYTVGGTDQFWDNNDNVRVEIICWYDEGKVGAGSLFNTSWATDDNRTRQFRVIWSEGLANSPSQGVASLVYPTGSPGTDEFSLDSHWVNPAPQANDGWEIIFNVTFEAQTRAADGQNFGNGAAAGNDVYFKNLALDDPYSWDMRVRIWDSGFIQANNLSFEEFGVYRFTNLTVTGNPSVSAPPGSSAVPFPQASQIIYSSNVPHFLNVSIPDLQRDGGGAQIAATYINVSIVNDLGLVDIDPYTELNYSVEGIGFGGAGMPWSVWGNRTEAQTYLNAPDNGTIAHGPWGSDFNNMGATQLNWWANVPASTPEGTYRAIITFSIEYP